MISMGFKDAGRLTTMRSIAANMSTPKQKVTQIDGTPL